jgi:hypothetical protein
MWRNRNPVFYYLITPWVYQPVRTLASFTTDACVSLLFTFCLYLFTFISLKLFSTSSGPSESGLSYSFSYLQVYFLKHFLPTLHWSFLITWYNRNTLLLLFVTESVLLFKSLTCWLIDFPNSCSGSGPCSFLNSFLSHVLNVILSFTFKGQD